MKDERDGEFREAAGKTTEDVGKILLDLQLEAEGKYQKDKGEVQEKLDNVEKKLEDDL
jgi:uncharacterized protein YjbJ (UPF0337 family)